MSVVPMPNTTGGNYKWPETTFCNCACYRCLQGDCCLVPNRNPTYAPATYVTVGTATFGWPHEHKWQPVGLVSEPSIASFGTPVAVIQSCECGEVRRVEVP